MALVDCPECGGALSAQAASCPHCGYPLRRRQSGGIFHTIAQIPCFVAGLILILLLFFIALLLVDVYFIHSLIPAGGITRL